MDNNNWRAAQGQMAQGQVGGGEVSAVSNVATRAAMDAGDWRTQFQAVHRQRIVNKIMNTLRRHLPFCGHEGLQESAIRFEGKIYTVATSQSDYLRKISLKMLTLEIRSQNRMASSLQPNAAITGPPSPDQVMEAPKRRYKRNLQIVKYNGNDEFVEPEPITIDETDNQSYKKPRTERKKKTDAGRRHELVLQAVQQPKFMIPVENRFNGNVTFNYTMELPEILNKYLSKEAILMFRRTVFGHILDLGVVNGQAQVVHGILLREIECTEPDMMAFYIGGTVLRFGIKEFGVVSGLRTYGNMNMPGFDDNDYRLKNKYFKEDVSVKKEALLDVIKYKRWDNDEDAVKLAILCVIHTYVLSSSQEAHINREDFALVESGKYAEYPWGLASFRMVFSSLKGRLAKRKEDKADSKSFHYMVDGCPVVFQTWFYECCPGMSNQYALKKRSGRPRMCNWDTQGSSKLQLKNLNSSIFDFPGLVVNNIVPTPDELSELETGVVLESMAKGENSKKGGSGGTSEINSRIAILENRLTDVSNDLDVFKGFVLKSFETFNSHFEEIRREMKDLSRKPTGQDEEQNAGLIIESSHPDRLVEMAVKIGEEA